MAIRGTLYIYTQQVVAPISGQHRELRVYLLSHVSRRLAFGKIPTVNLQQSTIHQQGSGSGDVRRLTEQAEREGYTVAYA